MATNISGTDKNKTNLQLKAIVCLCFIFFIPSVLSFYFLLSFLSLFPKANLRISLVDLNIWIDYSTGLPGTGPGVQGVRETLIQRDTGTLSIIHLWQVMRK